MRLTGLAALVLPCAALSACASSGAPVAAISQPAIAAAYIPLKGGWLGDNAGAAFVLAPGIAVTNAHNRNLLPRSTIIIGDGDAVGYDLLFFRTDRQVSPPKGILKLGQKVVAYGQGSGNELRIAHGVMRRLPTADAGYFQFEADAGRGFSGGPVLDAETGQLIGITWGYRDSGDTRLMYAYGWEQIRAVYGTLEMAPPLGLN